MTIRTNAPLPVRPIDPNLPRIDIPRAGFYKVRLVKNGPWVAARIWYGVPNDPETGEPLDRSPRWQGMRNGRDCDVNDLWPWCMSGQIDEAEYNHLLAVHYWAAEHAPDAPEATPNKAIDLNKMPTIF